MVSGKKRKEAERSGTSYGKRDQAGQAEPGQAELAWTGGGVRPNPPNPPAYGPVNVGNETLPFSAATESTNRAKE